VEYYDHTSPSIFVKFPLLADLGSEIPALAGRGVSVVIWTTTPWTLPANVAVALHPEFSYAAVRVGDEVLLLAEELVAKNCALWGVEEYEVLAVFSARALEGKKCRHPFLDRESLLVLADYVTLEAGTGCVHTAPGHGREDYLTGRKYDLPILSPVADDGRFTVEAGPYAGLFILEANPKINEDMAASGALIAERKLSHSYPHCWRCKKPVRPRCSRCAGSRNGAWSASTAWWKTGPTGAFPASAPGGCPSPWPIAGSAVRWPTTSR